jgi:uncharacterized protein
VPADLPSAILLILLTASDTCLRLWPYLFGGIALAVVSGRVTWSWHFHRHASRVAPLAPLAAVAGAVSPLPTTGAVPLLLRLREQGLPSRAALSFVLASLLMNPQLFVLTLGALGLPFALTQLMAVLMLSTALGLAFGSRHVIPGAPGLPAAALKRNCGSRLGRAREDAVPAPQAQGAAQAWVSGGELAQLVSLAGHVGLYFLVGVLLGAALQVLLPQLGILDWLAGRGLLSSPLLSWVAAPLYTCGGSAIPLARSLGQSGFSQGTLFTFLVAGPVLRGSALANLGCLLPRRRLAACLAVLLLVSGLLGFGLDQWLGWA